MEKELEQKEKLLQEKNQAYEYINGKYERLRGTIKLAATEVNWFLILLTDLFTFLKRYLRRDLSVDCYKILALNENMK